MIPYPTHLARARKETGLGTNSQKNTFQVDFRESSRRKEGQMAGNLPTARLMVLRQRNMFLDCTKEALSWPQGVHVKRENTKIQCVRTLLSRYRPEEGRLLRKMPDLMLPLPSPVKMCPDRKEWDDKKWVLSQALDCLAPRSWAPSFQNWEKYLFLWNLFIWELLCFVIAARAGQRDSIFAKPTEEPAAH